MRADVAKAVGQRREAANARWKTAADAKALKELPPDDTAADAPEDAPEDAGTPLPAMLTKTKAKTKESEAPIASLNPTTEPEPGSAPAPAPALLELAQALATAEQLEPEHVAAKITGWCELGLSLAQVAVLIEQAMEDRKIRKRMGWLTRMAESCARDIKAGEVPTRLRQTIAAGAPPPPPMPPIVERAKKLGYEVSELIRLGVLHPNNKLLAHAEQLTDEQLADALAWCRANPGLDWRPGRRAANS